MPPSVDAGIQANTILADAHAQTEGHIFIANFVAGTSDDELAAAMETLSAAELARLMAACTLVQPSAGPPTPPIPRHHRSTSSALPLADASAFLLTGPTGELLTADRLAPGDSSGPWPFLSGGAPVLPGPIPSLPLQGVAFRHA